MSFFMSHTMCPIYCVLRTAEGYFLLYDCHVLRSKHNYQKIFFYIWYIYFNRKFTSVCPIQHLWNCRKSFISHPFAITSFPHVLFCFFVFTFLFHLLFLLPLTLIINIFYCLNYTSLLLYLVTTHPLSNLSLASIIFSISMLIISIFYCLDCTLLLLHLIITHLVIDFIITM